MRIINPTELFELNFPMWEVTKYHIGNSKNRIVSIKNFFKYPKKLREYAESLDYMDTLNGQVSGIPGYVHKIGAPSEVVDGPILDIASRVFEVTEPFALDDGHLFTFQIYPISSSKKCRSSSLYPHVDNYRYAGVCSLNLNEECKNSDNSTAFWRWDATSEEHTVKDSNYRESRNIRNLPQTVVDLDPSKFSIEGCSIYEKIPHSFNNFIMYEGNLWHSPYFNASAWKVDRTTFNCFIN